MGLAQCRQGSLGVGGSLGLRRTILTSLLNLIVELLFGLLGCSIDLLRCSIDIPLNLLLDLLGLLIELLTTLLIVESLLVPSTASQLLGNLIDRTLDILLGGFSLCQGFCCRRTLWGLIDLPLKSLELALQLIELFLS